MAKNQLQIPGTERTKIKEIEDAAEAYVSIRDKRIKLTEQECSAKEKLIELMQQNKAKLSLNSEGHFVYTYDEELVILTDKVNVKVKRAVSYDDSDED
jgi:hypothetical protein